MGNCVTVEEKAIEWGVTLRHVQHLCRNGKIKGVVKHGRAWLIPVDAPIPVRNTKSNGREFKFLGTKKRIFESAIELFMLNGFERVSVKDIADHVGIRQSTIYNHFRSKQEILDTIYDFYYYCYLENRPSLEEIEPVIHNGSLADLMKCVKYEFNENYNQRMSDISKIIFQRIAVDSRAKEITQSLTVEEGVKYVETVFNRAIEIGRLAAFDTHIMALFINSVRLFIFYNWIINPSPDNMPKLLDDEQALYKQAEKLLTDLKSSAQND